MSGVFEAMILVSGTAPDAPPPGIPTLVVHGRRDTMMPVGNARAYARRVGAQYVELDAGHFAMLVQGDAFDAAVEGWLRARLQAVPTGNAALRL
jgi:pimeloyl-ACP methyl ester carboxylesterase